jgi:pyruvate-ferredoxin/flavodoxin oxidoreductase
VDLLLSLADRELSAAARIAFSANGLLLVQTGLPDERLWPKLPEPLRRRLKDGALRLFLLPPAVKAYPASIQQDTPQAEGRAIDYLLGAVCALLQQCGLLDLSRRRLLGLRAEMLRHAVADVDARLAAFEAGLDAPRQVDATRLPLARARAHLGAGLGAGSGADTRAGGHPVEETPALVRRIRGSGSGLDSLPRFWDRIGVLYRNGDTAELSPDPLLAIGAVPALSSGFRDLSTSRERLPLFDPDLCTSCGACWSACPESAIAAVAITPAQLIDAGLGAKLGTGSIDALRPLASKLAAGIAALCQRPEYAPSTAAELLDSAYAQMEDRLPFPAERKQAIGDALARLIAAIGAAPLVATEALFHAPESAQPGSGLLLGLSLNPNTCKACGLCVAVCDPGALRNERQSARVLAEARQVRAAWERLPDTAPDAIQRAAALPEPGALAALLLGQHAAGAMVGGDGNEPGSGARLALRLALSALSARQASAWSDLADEIDDTRARIAALVRETLAEALPADDLDALAERLRGVAARQADLGELLGGAGPVITGTIESSVDAARLRRLVDLARDLSDWAWRLRQGDHGLGRAGFGIVLSPGAAVGWAGAFPDNPYAEPVVLDWSGDGAQLAAGLLEGQLRQATRDLVLLRKARLELDRPADASRLWADLDGLSWRDLDDRELACCPSLLLVGDSAGGGSLVGSAGASLGGIGSAELHRLLGADLPLRVLLLADLDLGLDLESWAPMAPLTCRSPGSMMASIDLGLLAVSRRGAYIAQGSIAAPAHLAASLAGAFRHRGPSLLHLYAPSPRRHGFATDRTLDRARAAFQARVLPLFRYDPSAEGLFGSRIDLDGNPDPDAPWATDADGDASPPRTGRSVRPASPGCFGPCPMMHRSPPRCVTTLAMDDGTLPGQERAKRTPYIEQAANGAGRRRLQVDPALVAVCIERQHAWQVLQELAGVVTPFTARVQQQAEERVAAEHQAEIAALTADYERRIQSLRADYDQELRRAIKDRLMNLAGYRQAPPSPSPPRCLTHVGAAPPPRPPPRKTKCAPPVGAAPPPRPRDATTAPPPRTTHPQRPPDERPIDPVPGQLLPRHPSAGEQRAHRGAADPAHALRRSLRAAAAPEPGRAAEPGGRGRPAGRPRPGHRRARSLRLQRPACPGHRLGAGAGATALPRWPL